MSSAGFKVTAPGITTETPGLLEALASRLVTPRPDCALWPDPDHQGYGRIRIDGREWRVHRLFWELSNGPIPDGLTVDHLCRVRSCCNTAHMELVTHGENVRRSHLVPGPAALLLAKRNPPPAGWQRDLTHCKHGHEFTPENTRIRSNGQRTCRACQRAWDAARPPRDRSSRRR